MSEAEQYRAVFDAEVTFANGGGLSAEGFRVDVPSVRASEEEVAALFLTSLGLLMSETVRLHDVRIFAEPHKGTRGGPSDLAEEATAGAERVWVDLSHVITDGMTTYPGLPEPRYSTHMTREQSRDKYAPGTEFQIDQITMVGNTGTYLDSPFHRYPDAPDLSHLPLDRLVDLPAVVVRTLGSRTSTVGVEALAAHQVAGRAVLLHTGGDVQWGTPSYGEPGPHLSAAGATWLVEHDARLVGIDALNIDDTSLAADGARPAHSILLAAGIPVVEHLTHLEQLPPTGVRFTAAPPRVERFGTFPVRAYASVPAGLRRETVPGSARE